MRLPEGFGDLSGTIVKLHRALYGLKQSPRAWYAKAHSILSSLGFISNRKDPCLYTGIFNGVQAYITLYVDDLAIAVSGKDNMSALKQAITNLLPVKDLGELKHYLGFEFSYDSSQRH